MKLKNLSRLTALLLAFILCFSTVAEAAVPLSDLTTYGVLDGLLEKLGIKRVYGCLDYPLTLTFDKSLDDGEYTYQWHKITGISSSETVPSDATPSQLTIKPGTSTEYYYCSATNTSTGTTTYSSAFIVKAYGPNDAVKYLEVLSHIRSVVYPGEKMSYRVEAHKYMTQAWNTTMDSQNLAQAILTASTTSTEYTKLLCTCCIAADGSISDEILLHPYVAHQKGCPWEDYIITLPLPPQPPLYYGKPMGAQYPSNPTYNLPMVRAVILPEGGSATVTVSSSAVSAQTRGVTSPLQWQVYTGTEWANMLGETSSTLVVTTAKLQTIFNLTGVAHLRYYDRTNDVVLGYVDVSSQANAGEYPEEEDAAQTFTKQTRDAGGFTVEVNYVFENNEVVADPYTANLAAGSNFSATVTFPTVQGYLPYLDNVQQDSLALNYTGIDRNYTYTVVYKPTNVDYTVVHYQQNLNDDNYTEVKRETLQGLTNSQVPENLAKTYEGFYALLYEKPNIAADGSTVIEIYYDRYYYLMNFDLDGGYGVEPIYARYGADIGDVGEPTKAGYAFQGWTLNDVSATVPTTMPAVNSTYKALWAEANSSFTVVYWLENADDNEYSVFGTWVKPAQTGDVVNGEDYKVYNSFITTDANFQAVEPFVKYERADTNVTVAGDKSTIVNVYYNRQKYTLKFYYAMQNRRNKKYYIVGGTSYWFGADAGIAESDKDDAIKLIDQYMTGEYTNHTGEVDELPTLNATGNARSYMRGSDSSEEGYDYFYIAFTAKYGADISNLWPCNVFNSVTRLNKDNTNGWDGTEAFVSAWNGEHHVFYSQNNSNETIKGNYNQLDTQLLWDFEQFNAYADGNNTVDFLCFWENGANISWSVPELYRYKVWVPVLDGQDTTGLTTKVRDGVTYYLRNTYDTVDNSNVWEQTPPAINGLEYAKVFDYADLCVRRNNNVVYDPDTNPILYDSEGNLIYHEAWNVDFFYTRIQYNLTFQNDGNVEKTELVYFEAPLTDKSFVPSYPSSLEAGGYEFEGWYTSSTCESGTKFDFNSTMPANDLLLYANWVPKIYEVCFFQSESDMNNPEGPQGSVDIIPDLPHNTILGETGLAPNIEEFRDEEYKNYEFVGWFYRDANGVEKAFSIDATPIKGEMNIYAKWSSNTLMPYTILYKLQGTGTQIAAPITGSALAGTTKTFEAKGGAELNAGYQEGYFPVVKSHSMTIDINATTENDTNAYTFWYVQKDAVPYIVRYVDADGNVLSAQKVVANNRNAVVTEKYQPISGYLPDEYQKRLVVTGAGIAEGEEWIRVTVDGTEVLVHPDNVLTFVYTKDKEHAYWTITHYTENLGTDASGNRTWTEYSYSEAVGTIGNSYSASEMTIPGFTYNDNVDGTLTSGKLTANGLDLKLYYTRNSYPYQVRYLEQGSGKQLADPKNGTGKYGQLISESPIVIPNYTPVDPTSQTLNIRIEESTEAKLNIITFYYTENEATINYVVVGPDGCGTVTPTSETLKVLTGTAQGSTASAKENFKFVGWYSDEACNGDPISTDATYVPTKAQGAAWVDGTTYYAKFEYNLTTLTIKKEGMDAIDAGQSFLFKVTGYGLPGDGLLIAIYGNGEETISGLTVGQTYTVTEVESWSWRYTAESEQKITLNPTGNKVTIKNGRDHSQWLDGDCYAENVFNTQGTGN